MPLQRTYFSTSTIFKYEQKQYIELNLTRGHYFFDCYGASGGFGGARGGRGAHVSAHAIIQNFQSLYLFIGSKGSDRNFEAKSSPGGYNGGGAGGPGGIRSDGLIYQSGAGGGGATDIRLVPGLWDDEKSLNSRVLVAAGGGGAAFGLIGGAGGREEGLCSEIDDCCSYICGGDESTFGKGQDGAAGGGLNLGFEGKGGGGGGWFGGLAQKNTTNFSNSGGGGGSSYISGATGFEENENFKFYHAYIEDGEHSEYSGDGYIVVTQIHSFSLDSRKIFYFPLCYIAIALS